MIRRLAIGVSFVAIGAIGVVLYCGTSGRVGTPLFESMVLVLTVATPLGSALLTWLLWRSGNTGAALFMSTPIVLMLIGWASALAGRTLSLHVLLWLDFYVLLTFIIVLGRFGRRILGVQNPRSRTA